MTSLPQNVRDSQRNSPLTHFWIHDSDSGKLIWESSINGYSNSIDLHPDRDRVVTVEAKVNEDGAAIAAVQLWDIKTGTLLRSTDVLATRSQINFVRTGEEIVLNTIEAHPSSPVTTDGVLEKTGWSATFRILDSESLKLLRTFSIRNGLSLLDSRRAAISTYGDREVTFYDLVNGAEEIRMRGILEPPMTARTPDGKRVAFAVAGRTQQNDLSIWSLKSGHRLLTLPISGRPLHIAFSADGNHLLVAHQGIDGGLAITTWNATLLEK